METVLGDNTILRFENFQNSLLQTDKVALDIKTTLMYVYDTLNSSRLKEDEAIGVS